MQNVYIFTNTYLQTSCEIYHVSVISLSYSLCLNRGYYKFIQKFATLLRRYFRTYKVKYSSQRKKYSFVVYVYIFFYYKV